ncbi:STAS domain-containing protein [Nonomuraea zeae]|nr:STAS domain-containing protein [Nonomuraea zeae]
MTLLTVTSQHLPRAVVISVAGELDRNTVPQLAAAVERQRPGGARDLVFDLGELTFMDSSGLSVLLTAANYVRAQGGRTHLAAVRGTPARILEISGALKVFIVHDGVEDALALPEEPGPPRTGP